MAVERVVAGIDHGAGEPASIGADRGIEDLFRRLDPVDLARGLGPEPLGVGQRAGMDLVVTAVALDVHGALPVDRLMSSCPGLSWASTHSVQFEHGKTW